MHAQADNLGIFLTSGDVHIFDEFAHPTDFLGQRLRRHFDLVELDLVSLKTVCWSNCLLLLWVECLVACMVVAGLAVVEELRARATTERLR